MRCHLEAISSTQRICSDAVPWLNDDRGVVVVVCMTILLALATVAVILRVLARRISRVDFGIDDWLIGVALVSLQSLANKQKH